MILGIVLGLVPFTPGYQSRPTALKLYTDAEIVFIRKKFKANPKDGLLNVVPAGETKPFRTIFKLIGIEANRIGQPRYEQFDFVNYHIWNVSPNYELSIMTAIGSKANVGYGVRLLRRESK